MVSEYFDCYFDHQEVQKLQNLFYQSQGGRYYRWCGNTGSLITKFNSDFLLKWIDVMIICAISITTIHMRCLNGYIILILWNYTLWNDFQRYIFRYAAATPEPFSSINFRAISVTLILMRISTFLIRSCRETLSTPLLYRKRIRFKLWMRTYNATRYRWREVIKTTSL